jgi:hypothetical protein
MARSIDDYATLFLSAHLVPLHPGISEDLFEGSTLLRVYFEHAPDDMPCLAWEKP